MTVILKSQIEGKQVDEEYTGPREQWYVENGYAEAKAAGNRANLDRPTEQTRPYSTATPNRGPAGVNHSTNGGKRKVAAETAVQVPGNDARRFQERSHG